MHLTSEVITLEKNQIKDLNSQVITDADTYKFEIDKLTEANKDLLNKNNILAKERDQAIVEKTLIVNQNLSSLGTLTSDIASIATSNKQLQSQVENLNLNVGNVSQQVGDIIEESKLDKTRDENLKKLINTKVGDLQVSVNQLEKIKGKNIKYWKLNSGNTSLTNTKIKNDTSSDLIKVKSPAKPVDNTATFNKANFLDKRDPSL